MPSGEPLLLDPGRWRGGKTLLRDLANFVLVLVFYALCYTVGFGALAIDRLTAGTRRSATPCYDAFIAAVEFIDNGGR
jgi:hypothetical protein